MTNSLLHARMLEQTESWTPWDRRIWHTGTILTLQELVEASSWSVRGVLSDASVQWLRVSLRPELGRDPGLSTQATRGQLESLLKTNLVYSSQGRRQLERVAGFAADHYLEGWQAAASRGPLHLERGSRYIVSYLLDLGFHPEYLRKVMKSLSGLSEEELIEELRALAGKPVSRFEGWVLLTNVPEASLMQSHADWMKPADVAAAMKRIGQTAPRNQSGALRFDVEGRDEVAAATQVREQLERLVSRTRFLRSSERLAYEPWFWRSDGSRIRLRARGASVSAMSLAKSGLLYEDRLAGDAYGRIDDAFELASHLIGSPAPVAAANAWAAIESLLIDPGEADHLVGGRVVAADRAASILTAAWPRAELTRLSYRLTGRESHNPVVFRKLASIGSEDNVTRCLTLIQNWDGIRDTSVLGKSDQAAWRRMSELRTNPKAVLTRVENYMQGALRRLYRHRNLVMHGGELRPVALSATTRTTGPLVGALLDRLAVAAHLRKEDPLGALGRAEVVMKITKETGQLEHLLQM